MLYSKLGQTGLDCSALGFGTWQIGGGRWKGMSEQQSIGLLHHAHDSGVNVFDVAMVYGQYKNGDKAVRSRSLELLGKAFGDSKRQGVVVCLKVGQLDEYSHRSNLEPNWIVAQVQEALSILRTDYVDICLIHAPTQQEIRNLRALAVLETLQALGYVRFIGYSIENQADHAMVALEQRIDVLMLQYNLIDQECANALSIAADRSIGVLVGGPLKRGYLSGRYSSVTDFSCEDNYWDWNLRYAKGKVEANLAEVNRLKQIYGGAERLRHEALLHVLRTKGVTSAMVGHRLDQEVNENVATVQHLSPSNLVVSHEG